MSSEEGLSDEKFVEEFEEEAGRYGQNESFGEESAPKRALTKATIAECISMPYRLGYGFSHAFVKLDCTDKNLNDINVLRGYIHLRFIILSQNFIADISPVSVIGHLIYLKADNNQISDASCLNSLRFLQFLDLSGNKLATINNLSLPLLQHFKASDNVITQLDTSQGEQIKMEQFPSLHTLELRNNGLTTLNGVGNLTILKSLYCAENGLTSLENISNLTSLVRLHVRDNHLNKLKGFAETMSNLEYVNLRGNRISKFREIKRLQCLPSLKVLSLLDNPVTKKENYRQIVLGYLNKLQCLDKERVTDVERADALTFIKQYRDSQDYSEQQGYEEHHNAEEIDGEDLLHDSKIKEEQSAEVIEDEEAEEEEDEET